MSVSSDDQVYQLGVISGKLDLILVQMEANRATDLERFNKVEGRIESVEDDVASLKRDRSWMLGGAATLGSMGGVVAAFLGFKT